MGQEGPRGLGEPTDLAEPADRSGRCDRVRRWYEDELGWPTAPGAPVRLRVGVRFDVLDVPAEAGRAALWRLGPGSPVAVQGDRMRLLVAAGSAEELPGLLDWLEWGALALDLTAIGAGGVMAAPPPPGPGPTGTRPLPLDRRGSQGAAAWLRPPGPGCEVESSLPTLSAVGSGEGAPDLVRLVDTVAAQCHRIRLRRACARPPACSQVPRPYQQAADQPLAFSYSSRMDAGTRPRSLTS
ncbi:SCO3374 family protein [Streptomyces glaucus]|uniref:Proline-rich protein n=1 Tax=Streptomyces glaucus TaxID=284029 RepID=A0ABP5XIP0_9ACTN